MKTINHVFVHARRYGMNHRSLYIASLMFFFWTVFDAVASFAIPLLITDAGFSATAMGIILGSSSIAGAVFDFILAKFLQNAHFRRVYLFMFIISFLFVFVLWNATTIPIYLVAMALWGLYFDLIGFGNFDFVGRQTQPEEHVSSFGVLDVFKSLGYLLGPIFAGLLITEIVDFKVFILMLAFLVMAFGLYFVLVYVTKKEKRDYIKTVVYRHKNSALELKKWERVGLSTLPVLLFIILLNIYDSFFWTAGPLYSESFAGVHPLAGFFMAAYSFPPLVVGWFVGNIVAVMGGKKAIFISFLLGSLVLAVLPFVSSFYLVLLIVFLSSSLTTVTAVSVKALLVDRITDKPSEEMEVEALGDFSTNIGYVVGPMVAGVLVDAFGNAWTFSYMGIFGAIISFVLLATMKRKAI